jgi:hypothetical protein
MILIASAVPASHRKFETIDLVFIAIFFLNSARCSVAILQLKTCCISGTG